MERSMSYYARSTIRSDNPPRVHRCECLVLSVTPALTSVKVWCSLSRSQTLKIKLHSLIIVQPSIFRCHIHNAFNPFDLFATLSTSRGNYRKTQDRHLNVLRRKTHSSAIESYTSIWSCSKLRHEQN
jgi:hypothetical protein